MTRSQLFPKSQAKKSPRPLAEIMADLLLHLENYQRCTLDISRLQSQQMERMASLLNSGRQIVASTAQFSAGGRER